MQTKPVWYVSAASISTNAGTMQSKNMSVGLYPNAAEVIKRFMMMFIKLDAVCSNAFI